MRHQVLDEGLVERLESLPTSKQGEYIFLSPSPDFKGRWSVDSIQPEFFFDFEELIGRYRTVSPAGLDEFLKVAEEGDYKVVFTDPPEAILEAYKHLQDVPPFSLNSEMEGTVQGFIPWQVAGFNKLIRDEALKAGLVIWDTGTGKTAFIAAAIKWHAEHGHPFDFALVTVKSNNKADMNRKLKRLGDIDSVIIDGRQEKRWKTYEDIEERLARGEKVVAITNYEKLREDEDFFKVIVKERDVLAFWDEMPTRLSNRSTNIYAAVKRILWKRFSSKDEGLEGATPNPNWLRQFELTATPIENTPEGQFNCIRMMDPALLGWVEEFYGNYVAYMNPFSKKPEKWVNLDKMEARIEFMTHRVSREDPDVAKLFPEVMEDTLVIDWNHDQRRIYDILTGKAKEAFEEAEADFEDANILSLIQVMQMVCDAPSMLVESSANRLIFEEFLENHPEFDPDDYTAARGSEIATSVLEVLKKAPIDKGHTKLDTLRDILIDKHPEEKALVFMTWGSYGYAPLSKFLDEHGVTYVTYEGTQKQADAAKDKFREDPSVRVFLSSDRGADSIDLPEAAVGVNYNLPWTWVRKRQRMRNVRVDSVLGVNYWYDLVMADSIEERKQQIISTKHGYHKQLFEGTALEEGLSVKWTKEDLLYVLFGS